MLPAYRWDSSLLGSLSKTNNYFKVRLNERTKENLNIVTLYQVARIATVASVGRF